MPSNLMSLFDGSKLSGIIGADSHKAMIIAAHPDDGEFGAAGTAYLRRQGSLSCYHTASGKSNAYTMAKDAHHGSEQEERRLDDLHFQDELLAAGYDPTQGYASLEGDVVHGFEEKGFLRFDKDPFQYDYDHFDPGKKDATKAQQYISGQSPNYGATAPGAVVAKLDELKSQSVVRNEPRRQAISDEVRIIQRDGHAYLNIPSAAS